jgi:membrane protein required for colicin V production
MLTWADIVLLVILGLSTLVGLWRGFVVEVMSLAVWIAAFWLAFAFGDEAARLFEGVVQAEAARLFLGYAALFFSALLVGGLATWLMGRLVKGTGLSGTDRLFGLGFGLVRGLALGCLLVLLLGFTPLPQQAAWRESHLMPGFQAGAEWLRGWLPDAVRREVRFELPEIPEMPDPDATDAAVQATIAPPRQE